MGKYIIQRRGSPRTHQALARGCRISDVWHNVVHCDRDVTAEQALQHLRTDDGNGQYRIHYRPERAWAQR
jgi:hypothetical protein